MSFLVAPPGRHNDQSPEEGDVDQLLRAFYRAEMPNPWPPCKAVAEAAPVLPFPAATVRQPFFRRSRLALVASIALLMGGVGLLSGKFDVRSVQQTGNRFMEPEATYTRPGVNVPARPYMTEPRIDHDQFKISGGFLEEPGPNP